jgi:hypothetical protein
MMRDLLYLSENKMRALVSQLPGQLRRRLGFEAGINAGVMSAKATLQSESQPSLVALLDAVVEMIEQGKGPDGGPTATCAPGTGSSSKRSSVTATPPQRHIFAAMKAPDMRSPDWSISPPPTPCRRSCSAARLCTS